MKVYSWGFFFEDGNKAVIELPYGPERPDNMISSFEDPWMKRFESDYPNFRDAMDKLNLPFAFVIVNPPEEREDVSEEDFRK